MPANLTPAYAAAELRYRQAATAEERLEALREMLAVIPKHKGTEKLQADLKRRLSKAQEEQEHRRRSGGARHHDPGHVPREGAGQVALLGPPNSGKSSLLAALTHAHPEVAPYPFTTRLPLPGMMPFEDVQVQLVDTPPFAGGTFDPVLVNVARGADALAVVFALSDPDVLAQAESAVAFLERCRIVPEGREVPEELSLAARVLPVLLVWNKADEPGARDPQGESLLRETIGHDLRCFEASAATGEGLEDLRRAFFEALACIRVYAKEPGHKADLSRPFVLKRGATVLELAHTIHKELASGFRFARLWGSTRIDGLPAERDHVLEDRDIVEIHT